MKNLTLVLGIAVLCTGCAIRAKMERAYPVETAERATPVTQPPLEQPEPELHAEPTYVDIWLDCGPEKLGAYHVEIHYDPGIVAIERVESPSASSFSGSPLAKEESFKSGLTRIIGLAPGGASERGRIVIARVRFAPVAPGTSRLSVSIKSMYNPDSKALAGIASLSADTISVTRK
jgi:hypothetical protein